MNIIRDSKRGTGLLQRNSQKIVPLLLWLALLATYLVYAFQHELSPLEAVRALAGFMAQSPYGPLLFILAYTLRPLLLFSAALLTVAAGFLFGPLWGVVYTLVGSNLGATLAYGIGTFFGKELLQEGEGRLTRYLEGMRHHAFETVLVMRFLFLPYDLVNYAAGFLRVNYAAFLLATILGSLPGTLAFVLFGASSEGVLEGAPQVRPWVLLASAAIFVASLALSKLIRRRGQLGRA
ncbi:MAG: VTT domain-containing protein [Deinococcota bacterium]|nr:VTT domain-containing protein [Deinococcota bacterium]